MFDQKTEYSPDVEWLLQDKQANESTILKVLLAEHFERTLQLAYLLSQDIETANLITCETFANALVSRHHYSSDQKVQEWLDQILILNCKENRSGNGSVLAEGKSLGILPAVNRGDTDGEMELQLWQCLNALPLSYRLPYLLNSIRQLPVPAVARLLKLKEDAAHSRLEAARREMLAGSNGRTTADPTLDDDKIAACLSSSFTKRWEVEPPVPHGVESMIPAIQTMIEDKRTERRRRVVLQEILLVAIVVVLVFTLVQVAVSLSADPSTGAIPPGLLIYLFTATV